jgi:hypothetical protein
VVITPQIDIVRRLRNLSCRNALATRVPLSDKALHVARLARDNPPGSGQSPGIWRYLQIVAGAGDHDSGVIPARLPAPSGKFDRESCVRRADRLHSPRLTTRWRKPRQNVEIMARRTTRRGRGNPEAG